MGKKKKSKNDNKELKTAAEKAEEKAVEEVEEKTSKEAVGETTGKNEKKAAGQTGKKTKHSEAKTTSKKQSDSEVREENAGPEKKPKEEESLKEQFLRLQADFANFRNRVQRERIELYRHANEELFLELLPVIDHFELGLKTAEEHHAEKAVLDGFRLVYEQFQGVLKKFGVEPIDAVGEKFDPHRHEALTHMPSDEYPAETCSGQIRRGYMFGDKLLRAAQVVVSSGPAESEKDENIESGN